LKNADPNCERSTSLTWMSCIVKKKRERGLFLPVDVRTHAQTEKMRRGRQQTEHVVKARTARMITLLLPSKKYMCLPAEGMHGHIGPILPCVAAVPGRSKYAYSLSSDVWLRHDAPKRRLLPWLWFTTTTHVTSLFCLYVGRSYFSS